MSRDKFNDYIQGQWNENQAHHQNNVTVEYLITTKGEVVPFKWICRLSTMPFDNIDAFADVLATPPNTMNEMYAILNNGENVAFDLTHMDFTSHISVNQHGQYLTTDVTKRIIQTQFAQTNKEMPDEGQTRT